MMGRSHALLGAIGYASLDPLSRIDLPIARGILTAAWGVAFIAIVAMPANRGKTDSVVKKVGNSLYRGAYWVLQIAVVMVALLLRSEEHTSELQSRFDLVCRLLLEKKK